MLPNFSDAYVLSTGTLSARIQMFNRAAVYSFLLRSDGRFVHQHLMVRIADGSYETVPVFA
jgi:hypothetical protein